MQKTMNIILKAAAALLAVTLAASCVFEKEEPSQTQQKYKYVLVQLGVNTDKMIATKAQGDTIRLADSVGIAAETAIKDLKVYAYTLDASNNKVLRGYLSTQNVNAAATATKPLLMDIKVPFEEYGKPKQVYFMAVANAGGMTGADDIIISSIGRHPQTGALVLPDSFGFDDFAGIRYSVADQTFANGMPMYCQTSTAVTVNLGATEGTSTSTAPGHNGHTHLPVKVTLDMTRSLSKIEVYAAESAAETTGKDATTTTSVTITGVSLANVPASGNLFTAPDANTQITYTDFNGTEDGTGYSANLLKAGTVSKKVNPDNSSHIQNPDNYTLVSNAYYLAENNQGEESKYDFGTVDYTTVDNPTKATVLKIDYNVGGTDKTGYVKMPQIKRNTWYKVLARIKANGKAEIKVVAVAWNYNSEEISFEEIVSMTGSPVWKDNNGVEVSGATTSYTFGANKNQTATCSFTLQTPKGGTWYATIEGNDIQDFTFVKNGQEVKTVSGAIGVDDDMTFTIKTLTDIEFGQSKTVKVRLIAVSKDGISQNVQISGKDYFTITQQN